MKPILFFFLFSAIVSTTKAQSDPATSFDVEGIKVIYKHSVKEVIHVHIYFRGGVSNYAADKAGIEKLAVLGASECGTGKYAKTDFDDKKDLFGIEITSAGGLDNSSIRLDCIRQYFNEGWDLWSQAVTKPLFEEGAFSKMQQRMQVAARQLESGPDNRLRKLALQNAFSGTPYATDRDGADSTLGALTRAEVSEYYFKTLLNKSRIFIVVVGNISKEEISSKISTAFASLPPGDYKPMLPQAPLINSNSTYTEPRSMATNYIYGIMNAPDYGSPDYVPFMLAISQLHGILFTEIRTKRNLSYAPDASLHQTLLPYADVYVSTTRPRETVEVIANSINQLKIMDIGDQALNQIKALYITGSYMREETTGAIAESLGMAETLGNWQIAEQLPARVSRTTANEMGHAAKKYLRGIVWTYLGDPKLAEEASSSFNIRLN